MKREDKVSLIMSVLFLSRGKVDDESEFGNSWLYGECDTMEPPGGDDACAETDTERRNLADELCGIIKDDAGKKADFYHGPAILYFFNTSPHYLFMY